MRIIAVTTVAAAAALLLSACTTTPAVGSLIKLDPQTSNQCKTHCESLGMDLGAVVIIRNSTGCVCEPRGKSTTGAGGAAVSGGVAIVISEEEQAARQNDSRH